MQKKKSMNDGKAGVTIFLLTIGLLFFLISALFAWLRFKVLSKKHDIKACHLRVHEGGLDSIAYFVKGAAIASTPIWVILGAAGVALVSLASNDEGAALLIITLFVCMVSLVPALCWFIFYSLHIGSRMIGVLFFPNKGVIVIPRDSLSNTITQDLFQLKWIRDFVSLEEINMNSIDRITRERGLKFFIHGSFGSRRIQFSNKQKRDECIAALSRFVKKRIVACEIENF